MQRQHRFHQTIIALFMLLGCAAAAVWQTRSARAERQPAAAPALQGQAAVAHLKQQGLDSSLRAALGRATRNAAPATNFTQLIQLSAYDAEDNDAFGACLALSGDTAVIGAPYDSPAGTAGQAEGAAYVFVKTGNSYNFQRKLTAPDHADYDYFGRTVAIDGETIVVGAQEANDRRGKAYVFVRSGTTWSMQQILNDGQIIADQSHFGSAVAVSGNTVAIGADSDNNGFNSYQGSVYVFVRSGTTWNQQQKLIANDGTALDLFGHDVALLGNTLLVGAPYQQQERGAVYVFTRSVAAWTQQQKLTAGDGQAHDDFGLAVALAGNTAVIGGASLRDAAYVFVRSGSSWNQQQKLTVGDLSGIGVFGFDVAINGDTVVVGAPRDAYNQQADRGSAYVFTRTGTTWSQQQKLTDNNGYASNYFGGAVAVGADVILIGAPWKNSARGAAIAFAQPLNTPPTISALPVTRSAGSSGTVTSIANVNDAEEAESALQVSVGNATINGVTLTGLSVNGAGTVSATLATACNATTASFSLTVTDSGGATDTAVLTITVTPNPAPVLSYSSSQTVNLGGFITINPLTGPSDNGGVASLQALSITPSFNGGFTVNAAGVVTLGPSGPAGTYTVTVRATDNCGLIRNATFTLNITGNCAAITVNPATLASGAAGTNYNQQFSASGGTGPYSYAVSAGALPNGLSLSAAGLLSGTPSAAGTSNFTVRATDLNGCQGTRAYTLTVNSNNCTYALGTNGVIATGAGGNASTTVITNNGCNWTAQSNAAWLTITSGAAGSGNGTVNYTIAANPNPAPRTGTLTIAGQTFTADQGPAPPVPTLAKKGDFDGDGKADLAYWRGATSDWAVIRSSDGQLQTTSWGAGYAPYFDVIVPGDYDGDGKQDHAIWRGQDSLWYVKKSSDGQPLVLLWGANYAPYNDVPTPGDFDGDGKTDMAVWRPTEGNFYVKRSSNNTNLVMAWGQQGDIPVAADYDGDGKCDFAVWRPGTGEWLIQKSSGGTQTTQWGAGYAPYLDVPVVGDYDGDGKADPAIWRGQDSLWYIKKSSAGQPLTQLWGANYAPYFDVPTPGDYDGDGKADIAVWRPTDGVWYVKRSSNNTNFVQIHGQQGDTPVPAHGVK